MSRDYDWMGDHLRDSANGHRLGNHPRVPSGSRPSSPMLLDEANAMQFAIERSMESPMENAQASALSLSLWRCNRSSCNPDICEAWSHRSSLSQGALLSCEVPPDAPANSLALTAAMVVRLTI